MASLSMAPLGSSSGHLGWANWKMGTKILVLVLATLLVSVSSLGAYNYATLSRSAVNTTGDNLMRYSREVLQRSADIVAGSSDALQALALSPSLIAMVEEANQTYAGRTETEITGQISALDRAWIDKDVSIAPVVEAIGNSAGSQHLRRFLAAFPEEIEVSVTDVQGMNVAMTGRTSDYWQADEGWWQGAYAGGRGAAFLGDVELDESTGAWAINVGVPLRSPETGEVVGVLRGTVDVSVVLQALAGVRFGETGRAALLDRNGNVLYSHNENQLMQPAPDQIVALVREGTGGWSQDLRDLDGNRAVVAYQRLEGPLAEALGWTIVAEQDLSEVNAEVRSNLLASLIVVALLAGVLGATGWWAARSIALPLTEATRQAHTLAQGDITDTAEGSAHLRAHGDEIGGLMRALHDLRSYVARMAASARQLADGDLTLEVLPQGDGDVLGNAFAEMVANLREVIGRLQHNAAQLASASRQITAAAEESAGASQQVAATIQQVAHGTATQTASITQASYQIEQMSAAIDGIAKGAQDQARAVEQASASVASMSDDIREVSTSAAASAKASRQAAESAATGVATVDRTVASMAAIKRAVQSVGTKVQQMQEHSSQIGAIVETIDDIAGQTNLLALNAAIEAARAGEQGRGFAVVADEVRKLAERSSMATKEIAQLIRTVQAAITEAVQAMEGSVQQVEQGSETAEQAGQVLQQILQVARTVSSQVEQIATAAGSMTASSMQLVAAMDNVSAVVEENTAATEESAASTGEISSAIASVAAISEENSAAAQEVAAMTQEMSAQAEEVSAAAQSLADMAGMLQDLVTRFRIPEGQAGGAAPSEARDHGGSDHGERAAPSRNGRGVARPMNGYEPAGFGRN